MTLAEKLERIEKFREYKRLAEEAQAIADSIASELKAYMEEVGQDKMTVGEYKLAYINVVRKGLDTKRLQEEHEALYSKYQTETTYKRFTAS